MSIIKISSIEFAFGVAVLLGSTSALSSTVGSGVGLKDILNTPVEITEGDRGTSATILTYLDLNDPGRQDGNQPELPDQVPSDPPNDVPGNQAGTSSAPDSDHGMGMGLKDLLNTPVEPGEGLPEVIADWQESNQLGLFNTHIPADSTGGETGSLSISASSLSGSISAVPVPAAVWLFGSGLLGLLGFSRTRKQK